MEFYKAGIRKWRRTVFRTLKQIDPRWNAASPSFSSAMILAGTYIAGDDISVLAEVTGFPPEMCARVVARLRKHRVLRGDTLRMRWDDEKYGDIGFILDTLVASGDAKRVADPKMTKKHAETRLTRLEAGYCTNCGATRDGDQLTCAKCRESVKRSANRRRERMVSERSAPPRIITVKRDQWYQATEQGRESVARER